MDERWFCIGMNGKREGERRTTAAHPQENNHIAVDVYITFVLRGLWHGYNKSENPTATCKPGFLSDAMHEMRAPHAIAILSVAAVFSDDWPGFSSIIPHISLRSCYWLLRLQRAALTWRNRSRHAHIFIGLCAGRRGNARGRGRGCTLT